LVIIKLVSSAYSTNLAFLTVTEGKSFIDNKSRGPRIEPCGVPCLTIVTCGTPCSTLSQSE
jgi:hypothetical protein